MQVRFDLRIEGEDPSDPAKVGLPLIAWTMLAFGVYSEEGTRTIMRSQGFALNPLRYAPEPAPPTHGATSTPPPPSCPRGTPRAVFKNPNFFWLRTALKDSPQGQPTANRHQPPIANRHQPPTANHCSIVFLWYCHVLTMKQRASP